MKMDKLMNSSFKKSSREKSHAALTLTKKKDNLKDRRKMFINKKLCARQAASVMRSLNKDGKVVNKPSRDDERQIVPGAELISANLLDVMLKCESDRRFVWSLKPGFLLKRKPSLQTVSRLKSHDIYTRTFSQTESKVFYATYIRPKLSRDANVTMSPQKMEHILNHVETRIVVYHMVCGFRCDEGSWYMFENEAGRTFTLELKCPLSTTSNVDVSNGFTSCLSDLRNCLSDDVKTMTSLTNGTFTLCPVTSNTMAVNITIPFPSYE